MGLDESLDGLGIASPIELGELRGFDSWSEEEYDRLMGEG